MKTLKKLFSVSAIVALLGTLAPMYAFGATYTDELEDAYAYARANGVTTKNTIDEADMYGSLTRIAMAKMIANYATSVLGLEADTSRNCTFSDVSTTLDAEYGNGVTNACQLGLMGIDDNGNVKATFDPKGTVTRAQFATALSRAISQAEDGEAIANGNPYYRTHIAYLNGKGIVKSEAEYDVNSVEKRGYVMLMMMRADKNYTPAEGCTTEQIVACALEDDTAACLAKCSSPEEPEEPTGNGLAKVSGKAAASQDVALNAVDKKIGTVTLKAGEYDTTVTAIEITKSGLGAAADIANIQLMKNGEYVTNLGTLNSNKVAKLRFRPNLVLKANSSETFDVVVSMAGAAAKPNGQHSFAVTAVTVANGTFTGTPVALGSLTTTNYTVPEATVDLTASSSFKAGETKEIARLSVGTTVNATLNSATLTATPNVNEDLFNILSDVKAYIDDKEVGKVTINEETLVISNLTENIEKNEDVEIVLKGTNIYIGESVTVKLEAETGHVVVFEDNTNERMNSQYDTDNLTLGGVDLKITNNVTSAQTVSINTKNVVLLDMTISASNEMDITDYYVVFPITGDDLDTLFKEDEITLYVDGIDYTIKSGNLSDTGLYVLNTKYDAFTVSSNNSVKVQIKGTPEAGGTINNVKFGINKAKNIDTNTEFDVNMSKISHKTTVKGGNVTVSKATTPSANTIEMGGEQDVLFFKVKSPSEDVKLTGFNLTVEGTDSANVLSGRASTPITNIAIYKEGESTPIVDIDLEEMSEWTKATNKISTGIAFDGFNSVVSEGETVNFVVRATFDSAVLDDLGDTYQFTLDGIAGQGVTSKTSISATANVAGTVFTVVTDKPDVLLSKNGKFVNVTVKNESTYDVVLNSGAATTDTGFLAIEIERVPTNNDNYLLDLTTVSIEVLDGENGNRIGTGTYAAGVITVEFDSQFVVSAGVEEEFTIKLVSTDEIKDTYYNVAKKSIDFNYYDDTEGKTSKYVNVKY